VAEIHQLAYGWINPTFAFVMAFLGSLLGLILAARARQSAGASRARWLVLAAVAIGGTGIWLMHFMALMGFDVPSTFVRYDLTMTLVSLLTSVLVVCVGLFVVGFGRFSILRIIVGGVLTGMGIAAMHFSGMAGLRLGGQIFYEPRYAGASVLIAVAVATAVMWFAVAVHSGGATVATALITAAGLCAMHYTAMAAVRVRLDGEPAVIPGVAPLVLLTPVCIVACVVITGLAYATVGFSVRQENDREEDLLALAREVRQAGAMVPVRAGAARHR
jgi:NO-binding membrane sensor protein with MHYT domain